MIRIQADKPRYRIKVYDRILRDGLTNDQAAKLFTTLSPCLLGLTLEPDVPQVREEVV